MNIALLQYMPRHPSADGGRTSGTVTAYGAPAPFQIRAAVPGSMPPMFGECSLLALVPGDASHAMAIPLPMPLEGRAYIKKLVRRAILDAAKRQAFNAAEALDKVLAVQGDTK